MKSLYCAALIGAAIFFAYLVGVHIGNIKCGTRIANANSEQIILNTKIMEETNDAVFRTGIGDIRRVLRERYTIGE